MPIYEFERRSCGHICEFLIGPGEPGPPACPKCGSLDLDKIMSPALFLTRVGESKRGRTCCGREERCEAPPCSTGEACRRDR